MLRKREFVLVVNGSEIGRYVSAHRAKIKGSAAVVLAMAAGVPCEAWVYRVRDDEVIWASGWGEGGVVA